MDKNFYLCAPGRAEILNNGGTLRRVLFSGYAECLVDLLAVPVLPADAYPKHPKGAKTAPLSLTTTGRTITFSTFPVEVHILIFENLTAEEAFCLSLTSQHFWTVGWRHLLNFYASRLGSWAGSCIVNLSEDVKAGDHPPGLLPESWEEILRQGLDEDEHGYNGGGPATLFDFAVSRFDATSGSVELPSLNRIVRELEKHHDIPVRLLSGFGAVVNPHVGFFYPTDRPWILRNLTTCEYVHSKEIALEPRFSHSTYIYGPRIRGVGFGEVVLMRTAWSSTSDNIGMPYCKDIHRGVWAGHRLDITTHDRLTEGSSKGETEWKDISKEVAREIDEIWRNEFGDWRHTVTGVLEDEINLASGEYVPRWRYEEIKRFRAVN